MKMTRPMRAARLVDRLCQGPSIPYGSFGFRDVTIAIEFEKAVRRWIDDKIKPEVLALVPELQSK